jgi:hypothetical protein
VACAVFDNLEVCYFPERDKDFELV